METDKAIAKNDDGRVVKFAWPGGYRVWYVADDGEDLCAECVQENLTQCEDTEQRNSGWFVVGRYTEADSDSAGPCAHCGRQSDTQED